MLLLVLAGVIVFAFLMIRNLRGKFKNIQEEQENLLKHFYEKDSQVAILEKKLHKCKLLSGLVEQSPNAIMIMNRDGDIQLVNEGFSKMYGYTFEEFTAELGVNYRQTSFSPDVQARLDSVFETCNPYRYEAPNVTKDGRRIWTQTALMPILDDDGKITHLATIDTDIDQRVNMSDHLVAEVEKLNLKIDTISDEFNNFSGKFDQVFATIEKLYSAISKTDGILHFIKEISAQTRLIGFNASIEAGRAGEFGISFRVITNEIVDIAQRTQLRVQQIKQILGSIKSEQSLLDEEKQNAGNYMATLNKRLSELKDELHHIENAISGFKTLS
jgi:PAS domain S-box-containing protein